MPLVAQVSAADIQATTAQLSSYFTRRADSATVLVAKDWLVAQLAAIPGVQVSTSTFTTGYGPNIIATIPGNVHPERVVVLGAHYDSINQSGATLAAPGADDDGSGSAACSRRRRSWRRASSRTRSAAPGSAPRSWGCWAAARTPPRWQRPARTWWACCRWT